MGSGASRYEPRSHDESDDESTSSEGEQKAKLDKKGSNVDLIPPATPGADDGRSTIAGEGARKTRTIREPTVREPTIREPTIHGFDDDAASQGTYGDPFDDQCLGQTTYSGPCKITVNGIEHVTQAGKLILEVLREKGVPVPSLCWHPRLPTVGKCKLCAVEMKDGHSPDWKKACACASVITPDMQIRTESHDLRQHLAETLKKIAHAQKSAGFYIIRGLFDKAVHHYNDTPDLQRLFGLARHAQVDNSNQAIVLDVEACTECSRCVTVCREVSGMNIYSMVGATAEFPIVKQYGRLIGDTECVACGQCAVFCPSGAIQEQNDVAAVVQAMQAGKVMVAGVAPSSRIGLGEMLGLTRPADLNKVPSLLRALGFQFVFDTNFTADLTIMEEGHELLGRIKAAMRPNGEFVMKVYPELLPHLSTARSPQQMLGSLVKNYFARKLGRRPDEICYVSIMPCTAKKQECKRPQLRTEGLPDVDYVLTVRETAAWFPLTRKCTGMFCPRPVRLIKELEMPFSIRPETTEESAYDNPLGTATGAAQLFGVSGGVMEAALRTAYELYTQQQLPRLTFHEIRGLEGLRTSTVMMGNLELRVAVVSGGAAVRRLVDDILSNRAQYHFIEVMFCPGGCLGGGGMPRSENPHVLEDRAARIYGIEERSVIRKSHENPQIRALYEDFLGEPLSPLAHRLLHTTYTPRPVPKPTSLPGGALAGAPFVLPDVLRSGPEDHTDGSSCRTASTNDDRTAEEEEVVAAREAKKLSIFYATQTGNALAVAKLVVKAARQLGYDPVLQDLGKTDRAKFGKVRQAVFVVSTFWDGHFPEHARGFWDWLSQPFHDRRYLKLMRYSVFGLGNSTFELFNHAARCLDKRLLELGAKRLSPIGEGDYEAKDRYRGTFKTWSKSFWRSLQQHQQVQAALRAKAATG
ncbi:iron hydrogenase [Paratrimastix pyriformis]|uniref:Iron hydrogenase n=1 Tax=Paratrimastix pyriformis TaxID=342808 RepID=A0ABQ8UAG1_9EUKA|nr:iron hydrogenase [Paratrimastix pyriformis]